MKPTTKILVAGSDQDSIVKAQREPFNYHREELHRYLNASVQQVNINTFADIQAVCRTHNWEHVFLLPFWRESPESVEQTLQSLRAEHPGKGIFFIDPFAQTSSTYFNVLPYVDRLLKRQRYRDLGDYKPSYAGGMQLTDYLSRECGFDLNQWNVSSPVPLGYEERILSGWNLGTAKKFRHALLSPMAQWWRSPKNIDVFCRMSLGAENHKEWYYQYRSMALDALQPLAAQYRLAASGKFDGKLLSQRQYDRELKHSRMVFSPFGWGETCWRDFEAICHHCLLLKPAMDHIDTQPNIFVANKTYVPLKWDFSDLEEKVAYYLENPDEAALITQNARRAYEAYFRQNKFVETVRACLETVESIRPISPLSSVV